jgi:hypothetical protein
MNDNKESIDLDALVVSALSKMLLDKTIACEDFTSIEKFGIEKAMGLLRKAMAQSLEAFDQMVFSEKDPRFCSKGFEKRELLTMAGPVSFCRRRYASETGCVYLVDAALGIAPNQKTSALLTSELARLSLDQSYRAAGQVFALYLGETLHKTTVKTSIARSAALLDEVETIPEEKRTVPTLDIEADGIFVPLQRTQAQKRAEEQMNRPRRRRARKEVSVLSAYEGKKTDHRGRKRREEALHYASSLSAHEVWEAFASKVDGKWDIDALYHINFATDGDTKYEGGITHFDADISCGYDLFHIVGAIKPLFGIDVAREVYAVMKDEGFKLGLQVLYDYSEYYFEKTGNKGYNDIYDFIKHHETEIITAFSYNLGTIEGTNAHIIKDRMKGRGVAWSSGLEPMARLQAHRASKGTVPIATPGRDCDLVVLGRKRTIEQIESAIAAMENRAKATKRKPSKTSHTPYYRQVTIGSSKAREANHSYLHLWS